MFYMPPATPLLLRDGESPSGGAENQIVMLARELARRGQSVAIVAFDAPGGLRPRVDHVDVIAQPVARSHLPIVRTLEFYLRTLRTLRANRADVLVQHAAGVHTVLAALIARMLGSRFVYASAAVEDFDFRNWESRRWIVWAYYRAVRSADEIVVQTGEQVSLCRARFRRQPILIPSIAEPHPLRTAEPEAFLWIGRLNDHKQPLMYAELARRVPEARFHMIVVGLSSSDRSSLGVELIRAVATLPNLKLLAPRPRAELAPLIERAVAIVSTSRSEGMPNVFLEGWSRGVPALALSHDSDGVIERERVGAYAHGSPARLAEEARAMWIARDAQQDLAARCREYVSRHHLLEQVADRWMDVLEGAPRSPT